MEKPRWTKHSQQVKKRWNISSRPFEKSSQGSQSPYGA